MAAAVERRGHWNQRYVYYPSRSTISRWEIANSNLAVVFKNTAIEVFM
jgi:hypothetical protein